MKKSIYSFILAITLISCVFTVGAFSAYAQDTADIQTVENLSFVTSNKTSVTLSWNESENANGYEICMVSSDTYTAVGESETTSYTSSKLKSGTAYKYSVRAFSYDENGEKVYSAYSNTLNCVTLPSQVKISSISTPSTTSVKLSWKKVNCTGYQIQYATNSKFTKNSKTATVKSSKSLEKTLSKLNTGKTYYVRVRAYITCNGKKYYGDWSSTKKQKVYTSKTIVTETTLRKSNAWSSKSLATLKKDANVRIIKTSGKWYQVEYNGKTGYVYNLAFKKSGSQNLSRTKVTTSNYKTYLDDVLFKIGTSQSAIYNYVCKDLSYSYSKTSTAQRKANINSLSKVKSNEALLVSVAITKKGGICYNFAAYTKALYERAGYDAQIVCGKGKYGDHCWVIVKTSKGYRHMDTVRKAYSYTDKQFNSSSKTSDLSWSKSQYPKCV